MLSDEMRKNFDWFVENMPRLYAEHGDCYAVVYREEVVGIFDDKDEAWRATRRALKPGTFNIQHVGADESAYTVRI